MTDDEILASLHKDSMDADRNKVCRYIYDKSSWSDQVQRMVETQSAKGIDWQDIFQETILSFEENIKAGKFQRKANLKTYFVGIARLKFLGQLRKKGKIDPLPDEWNEQVEAEVEAEMNRLEREAVWKVIYQSIGERCEEILSLFKLGYSYQEIADRVDSLKHVQMVTNETFRCRRRMSKFIAANPELRNRLR